MSFFQNNRIERYWVENNQRVAYPIKSALIELESMGIVDVDVPHHLFSISRIAMWIAAYGAEVARNAWNYHHVRGK